MEFFSAVFFTSLVVVLSGAIMPGSLLTVTINKTAIRSASAGSILVAGVVISYGTFSGYSPETVKTIALEDCAIVLLHHFASLSLRESGD